LRARSRANSTADRRAREHVATIQKGSASRHFSSVCSNWVGSIATCGSRPAVGRQGRRRAQIRGRPDRAGTGRHLIPGGAIVGPLQATRASPSCHANPDPVAAGFAAPEAARRQCHGLTQVEYGTASKWLELLKEIAPYDARGDPAPQWYPKGLASSRDPIRGASA
jgi:hypothetical protein